MNGKGKMNDDYFSEGRNRKNRHGNDDRERFPRGLEENFRKYNRNERPRIIETKLFTSRDDLVKYVNEKGQSDALIDIYKIEDELYKLVIKR